MAQPPRPRHDACCMCPRPGRFLTALSEHLSRSRSVADNLSTMTHRTPWCGHALAAAFPPLRVSRYAGIGVLFHVIGVFSSLVALWDSAILGQRTVGQQRKHCFPGYSFSINDGQTWHSSQLPTRQWSVHKYKLKELEVFARTNLVGTFSSQPHKGNAEVVTLRVEYIDSWVAPDNLAVLLVVESAVA